MVEKPSGELDRVSRRRWWSYVVFVYLFFFLKHFIDKWAQNVLRQTTSVNNTNIFSCARDQEMPKLAELPIIPIYYMFFITGK